MMHNALVFVEPVREHPVPVPRHNTISVNGTSVVHVICDSDLGNSARGLDHVTIGHRQWLLVDLTTVTFATPFECGALIKTMDRVSPGRFCIIATQRSPWVGEMFPTRTRQVTFQSVGDALQMLVLAGEGFSGEWPGSALVSPVKLNVTQSWLARCPLAPRARDAAARHTR